MFNLSAKRFAPAVLKQLAPALLMISSFTNSQAQITMPRAPSPAATVSQTVGISTITVNYSRPSVRGRQIWGTQVPYGYNIQGFGAGNAAPWRAGANENTVLRLSHPAMVEGHAVPAGEYGLFFVINKDNSTGEVILSKDSRSWGSFWYDPAHDLMRAPISLRPVANTEILTYDFSNISRTSAELTLNWEKLQFPVKIEFAVDDIVIANSTEELKGAVGFSWQNFAAAANYTLQNKVNLDQGIKWIDAAIAQNKSFNTLSVKAGLLGQTGKKDEATKLMDEAVAISNENELNAYGYQLLGGNQPDTPRAIQMFIINTQRHPKSPNTWDSLGEGYALQGDKKNAIINFKKSLSLNPPANVKANSEKYLKQLGAM
jgi:tetratricopeptide (TPR) repeat protein